MPEEKLERLYDPSSGSFVPQPKARRVGQRMSDEDRRGKTMKSVVIDLSKFIRLDVGGTDHLAAMEKKAREFAKEKGVNISDGGFKFMAEFVLGEVNKQLEGCRKRTAPNFEELKRRTDVLEGVLESLLSYTANTNWLAMRDRIAAAVNGESAPTPGKLF